MHNAAPRTTTSTCGFADNFAPPTAAHSIPNPDPKLLFAREPDRIIPARPMFPFATSWRKFSVHSIAATAMISTSRRSGTRPSSAIAFGEKRVLSTAGKVRTIEERIRREETRPIAG